MPLSLVEYAVWIPGTLLRLLLCSLLLRRSTFREIPFFSAFVFLATARTLSLWWIYHDPTLESGIVFNFYWVTQLLNVAARGLAAAEVCWLALRAYRGVWELAWRLLAGVGLALTAFAAAAALSNTRSIAAVALRSERGLELAVAGLLLVLLAFSRYYGIRVPLVVRYIAAGLGLHAGIEVINDSFMYAWFASFFPWFAGIRVMSFDIALAIWCWGLRHPVAFAEPKPVLLEAQVYDEVTPQVSRRLRELNSRLLEMLK
jgi:hypothetical protein